MAKANTTVLTIRQWPVDLQRAMRSKAMSKGINLGEAMMEAARSWLCEVCEAQRKGASGADLYRLLQADAFIRWAGVQRPGYEICDRHLEMSKQIEREKKGEPVMQQQKPRKKRRGG